MNFLLSGYYGYANAGDEAVLAAILEHISDAAAGSTFTVTSGDPIYTETLHNVPRHAVRAIPRQNPKSLVAAIRACDVFISGGGSLLQDVTSLRNVVYYTSLIRFARLSRKPVMIYAQGVGPLRQSRSQKLARVAMHRARLITVRDDDSKALLQRIGVGREITVTADPVWALQPTPKAANTNLPKENIWCLSLRSWPGVEDDASRTSAVFQAITTAARQAGASLRFLPMQFASDAPLIQTQLGTRDHAPRHEIIDTSEIHPREVLAEAGQCSVMIAMRLHALIFAASLQVPCVAINYDPKVESLARLIGAPLLNSSDFMAPDGAQRLLDAIAEARPLDSERLATLQAKAKENARLAVQLNA